MEEAEILTKIKEKHQAILELQFRDKFTQLEFLVDEILELINYLTMNEQDKEKKDSLSMKYLALTHTRNKEVKYVTGQSQRSRKVLVQKLNLATKQIGIDLLGLV